MSLTDEQRQAILDEIIAATEPPRQKPYQFSGQEYQMRQKERGVDLSERQAYGTLRRAVEDGFLLREKVVKDGKKLWVYWREEDET